MADNQSGVIFNIQRWSIHDGPGVRTLVFFKGCPLECRWCCNPESQAGVTEILIRADECTNCGRCLPVCPEGIARTASEGGFADRGLCLACGRCIEACPTGARAFTGQRVTLNHVLSIVRRDAAFYRASGGGVTLSGGEPLAQPEFAGALVDGCRALGIGVVIETCGCFDWTRGREIIEKAEQVFLDLKHMDPAQHQRLTGVGNELILKNAVRIAETKTPLIIRIPVIPTLNDSLENISNTAGFVHQLLPSALDIELMPYHRLGLNKYAALGREYELASIDPPDEVGLARLKQRVKRPA